MLFVLSLPQRLSSHSCETFQEMLPDPENRVEARCFELSDQGAQKIVRNSESSK